MLEMIRAYALAELNAQHEYDATAQAHAAYFLHLAETEPDEPMWLAQMAQEHDNLRAVLRWAVAHDARETGLRLCIALWWFWDAYGHWNEGRQWTETMLAAAEHAAPHYRMGALRCVAEFAWKQGDHVHADKVLKEILTLAQVVNHPAMSAHATMLLGKIALDQGDVVVADSLLHQSVAMWQSLGDNALVPRLHLGELALVMGEYVQARHILEENLALCEATDDMFFTVVTLRALGEALIGQGEHQAARKLLREGIAHSQIIDHQRVLVTMLTTFASPLASGSHPQANDVCIAARIWAAVQVVRDDVGMFVSVGDRVRYEQARTYAQTQVSANAWSDAWEQGRALSLNQALTLALSLPPVEL
jgi:ATP/maltotriose-dependent transcriptional regulator MalT